MHASPRAIWGAVLALVALISLGALGPGGGVAPGTTGEQPNTRGPIPTPKPAYGTFVEAITALTTANNIYTTVSQPLPPGWISTVAPTAFGTTSTNCPHGRYYGSFTLNAGSGALLTGICNLWTGYIWYKSPTSLCTIQVQQGMQIQMQIVAGTNGATTGNMGFRVLVTDSPIVPISNGSSLWFESQASGPGEIISKQVGTVTAGDDISVTVPAAVRWKLRSLFGLLTASAAAANRVPLYAPSDGTNLLAFNGPNVSQTANDAWYYLWGTIGISLLTSSPFSFAIPDLTYPTGYVIKTQTASLQGGDQWTLVNLQIEEWAMPKP